MYAPVWVLPPLRGASAGAVVGGGFVVLAFLFFYFWTYRLDGRRKLWSIAGMTALGCLYLPWNPGGAVFWVYAASLIGEALEPRPAYGCLAGLLAVIAVQTWITNANSGYGFWALMFSAMLGAVMIHDAQQRRFNNALVLAREEVEHLAKVAERERIGRDLHDLLGHTLSVNVLKSELASKLAGTDPARSTAEIRDVERIAREALAEVRSAVLGFSAVGFEGGLQRARQTPAIAGVRLDSVVSELALSGKQETVLALALREAVTNILRHARATTCHLRLGQDGSVGQLEISDDSEAIGKTGVANRPEASRIARHTGWL